MYKKILFLLTGLYFLLISLLMIFQNNLRVKTIRPTNSEGLESPASRLSWEFNRLKDPATNKIPEGIFIKELEFASGLPNDSEELKRSSVWNSRGPWHVGGRTRSLAIDIADENTIMAGAVSGGIWRSVNGGSNWSKITPLNELQSVSCMVQDTRTGKTNNWYYGTGELYGNSASSVFAFYTGNGIYKSTDNGLSWQSLTSTASNTPQGFDIWDGVWNLAIDHSNDTQDVVYAATYGTIFRSGNGGDTWKAVLGGISSGYSYFTDVAVTSIGVVYATLSKDGYQNGIWRSANGIKWTNITPAGFPTDWDRIIIGIDPNNENNVYFLGQTPKYGKKTVNFRGTEDWNSLWKFSYISGDSTSLTGSWKNLTDNLPVTGIKGNFDDFNAQGSYNLVIKVKPGDSNTVIIGGTNLYRSTDAFSTPDNTMQIGGYEHGTKLPEWHVYLNHHPDQHVVVFLPSNSDIMLNANDGGIFKTNNCLASTVTWLPLNNGYLTTQAYTVNIDKSSNNDVIIAGFQDNGNYFVNSPNPSATWTLPLNGDGSYSAIAPGGSFYIFSKQEGKMQKITLDINGNKTAFARIDPIGGKNYQFINPFVLDPNDDNLLYLAAGRHIWRNNQLRSIPLAGNYDSISYGWVKFSDSLMVSSISALAISKNPANRLYIGSEGRAVYRIDNVNTGNPSLIKLPVSILPANGNVSCIAIDPRNADNILVAYSNYNIYSLFSSINGGYSWVKEAGNLEENSNGSGNGPSLRWVSIIPYGQQTLYLVGTSVGLFATDSLKGLNTVWKHVGTNSLGNSIVDMISFRETDGTIAIATHGSGIFTARANSAYDILGIKSGKPDNKTDVNIYPNPANNEVFLSLKSKTNEKITVQIFQNGGKFISSMIFQIKNNLTNKFRIDLSSYHPGYYQVVISSSTFYTSRNLLIVK